MEMLIHMCLMKARNLINDQLKINLMLTGLCSWTGITFYIPGLNGIQNGAFPQDNKLNPEKNLIPSFDLTNHIKILHTAAYLGAGDV